MQVFDFAVAVMFLLSLIAVSRFRRYLSTEDKSSYNHILAGLSVLAVASLAQVYRGLGVFGQIPFLAEEIFFRLIFWIGMITGLGLLIEGVTTWVPLSRSYRKYNSQRIARLELIKQVEQLVRVEHRIPVVLETTLRFMVERYDLAGGEAYLLGRKERALLPVATTRHPDSQIPPLPAMPYEYFSTARREYDQKLNADSLPIATDDNAVRPHLVIPVWAAVDLAGFFVLWTRPDSSLQDEDRMNLKLAGDVIGHVVCREMLQLRQEFNDSLSTFRKRLSSSMDLSGEPKDNILTIASELKKKVNHDYFSLTIVFERSHAQRFTIGENGGLLTEPNLDIGKAAAMTRKVLESGRPILVPNLTEDRLGEIDEVLKRGDYRSIHAFPVKNGVNTGAVLTLASQTSLPLCRISEAYIEAALSVVGELVTEQKHRHQMNIVQRRSYLTNKFLSGVTRVESIGEVFAKATDLIFNELKPTVVRLSVADADAAFLNSQALELSRSDVAVAPAQASMILSIMPYHQLVMDTGRLMMINQERTDRRLTEAESSQVFGTDVSSALLVPIKVGNSTVGIISLGETRSWSRFRFGQSEIQFVTAIAAAVSVALQLSQKKPRRELVVTGPEPKPAFTGADTRSRIKSSLSGIIGSVELLKTGESTDDKNLQRCLSIIDKSARRIGEYISSDAGK